MLMRIRILVHNELVCFVINHDDSDGCHVAFVTRGYVTDANDDRVADALICLVSVLRQSTTTTRAW